MLWNSPKNGEFYQAITDIIKRTERGKERLKICWRLQKTWKMECGTQRESEFRENFGYIFRLIFIEKKRIATQHKHKADKRTQYGKLSETTRRKKRETHWKRPKLKMKLFSSAFWEKTEKNNIQNKNIFFDKRNHRGRRRLRPSRSHKVQKQNFSNSPNAHQHIYAMRFTSTIQKPIQTQFIFRAIFRWCLSKGLSYVFGMITNAHNFFCTKTYIFCICFVCYFILLLKCNTQSIEWTDTNPVGIFSGSKSEVINLPQCPWLRLFDRQKMKRTHRNSNKEVANFVKCSKCNVIMNVFLGRKILLNFRFGLFW